MCRRKDYEKNKKLKAGLEADYAHLVDQFQPHFVDDWLRETMLEMENLIKTLERRIEQYEEYIL